MITTASYDGDFRDGRAEGRGTLIWSNGTRFDGEFKTSKRSGHGTIVEPSGARFEGEFKDDRVDGHGIIEWPDGTRFEGEFKEDLCSGAGELRRVNADSTECQNRGKTDCGVPGSGISHTRDDREYDGVHSPSSFCADAAQALTSPIFASH